MWCQSYGTIIVAPHSSVCNVIKVIYNNKCNQLACSSSILCLITFLFLIDMVEIIFVSLLFVILDQTHIGSKLFLSDFVGFSIKIKTIKTAIDTCKYQLSIHFLAWNTTHILS